MKRFFIALLALFTTLLACKSTTKQQADSLYSRHLQQKIALSIISTSLPDKKGDMNLLFFNKINRLEELSLKKIIDSLFKNKLIQPITLVAFDANSSNYGLEDIYGKDGKQYKKLNEFVADELYMYVKKKTTIRKFNSVGIYGDGKAAISSFDIAWHNDEKVQLVGMENPIFTLSAANTDSLVLKTIQASRKRPTIKIWLATNSMDSTSIKFAEMINNKPTNNNCAVHISANGFADFLLWAFPK